MTKKRTTRRKFDAAFKSKVAIEAMKERNTTTQIASEYGVYSTQISTWKKQALASIRDGFKSPSSQDKDDDEKLIASLFEEIGRL